MTHPDAVVIRPARESDCATLVALVRELAEYEREPDAARASEQQFREALFPEQGAPAVFALIADGPTGEALGMAIWFRSFSTWTGTHGLWLEDLYVRPAHRGRGVGGALLAALARVAIERGYERFEWNVLDWNQPAIDVYEALGAVGMTEWTTHRLSGEALRRLAARA